MQPDRDERLSETLLNLLGENDFLRLVEMHGGTRLFVPSGERETKLREELGSAAVDKLVEHYARDYIRVPLARAFRARHYHDAGMTNPQIARKLGMSQSGVEKLMRRVVTSHRAEAQRRQLDLFSSQ